MEINNNITFYGPVDFSCGLGTSSRSYYEALCSAGFNVNVRPVRKLFQHHSIFPFNYTSHEKKSDIAIIHINPDAIEHFLRNEGCDVYTFKRKIGICYWELSALRPSDWYWVEHFFDELWAPSHFCQRAFSAVSSKPVIYLPPPVIINNRQLKSLIPKNNNEKFIFLYCFDASSYIERKNPKSLIDAFICEFGMEENCLLILKVMHADANHDFYIWLINLSTTNSNIQIITETYSPIEIYSLMAQCDVYVSPHRSEGFGLTIAEAMFLGKPVIATNYGGTTDFVTKNTGYPVDYSLVEIDQTIGPYPQGYVWADPSIKHLRECMRDAYINKKKARRLGNAGLQLIKDQFSPNVLGNRIKRALNI